MKIAFAGVSTHRMVTGLAHVVRSEHPGIELELSSRKSAQTAMKKLLDGGTDIASGRWDVIPASIDSEVVLTDHLVMAVTDTHALAGVSRIGMDRLAGEHFTIGFDSPRSPTRPRVAHRWTEATVMKNRH